MNHRIIESIITTLNPDRSVHIAPMGVWESDGGIVLAPFKPSTTLDNLESNRTATINFTTNVQIFAGCLTGHHDWAVHPTRHIDGVRLDAALTHTEVEIAQIVEHSVRPEYHCKIVYRETHDAFNGFNRAQAAVLELAILVSRLHMLPMEKIDAEMEYLSIAISKTAGPVEREAWTWLSEKVQEFRCESG